MLSTDKLGYGTCIVCGGTYTPTQRLPGLVQCNNCSFLSAKVSISDEELRALYGQGYFRAKNIWTISPRNPAYDSIFAIDLRRSRQLPRNSVAVTFSRSDALMAFFSRRRVNGSGLRPASTFQLNPSASPFKNEASKRRKETILVSISVGHLTSSPCGIRSSI